MQDILLCLLCSREETSARCHKPSQYNHSSGVRRMYGIAEICGIWGYDSGQFRKQSVLECDTMGYCWKTLMFRGNVHVQSSGFIHWIRRQRLPLTQTVLSQLLLATFYGRRSTYILSTSCHSICLCYIPVDNLFKLITHILKPRECKRPRVCQWITKKMTLWSACNKETSDNMKSVSKV